MSSFWEKRGGPRCASNRHIRGVLARVQLTQYHTDLLSVLQAPCVLGLRLRWCYGARKGVVDTAVWHRIPKPPLSNWAFNLKVAGSSPAIPKKNHSCIHTHTHTHTHTRMIQCCKKSQPRQIFKFGGSRKKGPMTHLNQSTHQGCGK